MKRISVVTNIAAPYRLIQIKELQRKLKEKAIVNTFLTQGMTADRKWGMEESSSLFHLKKVAALGRFGALNLGLVNIVRNSDVVFIGGYEQPTYILLTLLCRLYGVPYVIIYDGISTDRIESHKSALFSRVKIGIVSSAAVYLLNGDVSKKYFDEVLNVDPSKIYNQFLSVNLHGSYSLSSVAEKNMLWRKRYDIPLNERVVLYSGRLIDIKNVELLINSVATLKNCTLLIAGDGVLYEHLKSLAKMTECRILFLGHLDEAELSCAYSVADCLVLPSEREPWGLVVNEALCYSTPVVVSKNVGCHYDQIIDGVNGVVASELTVAALAEGIEIALKITKLQVFNSSVEILNVWNLTNSAENIVKMLVDINIIKR
jgi:glycosyltransferase involved in cell wall biosynthesis